jgi:hypothetical protein
MSLRASVRKSPSKVGEVFSPDIAGAAALERGPPPHFRSHAIFAKGFDNLLSRWRFIHRNTVGGDKRATVKIIAE